MRKINLSNSAKFAGITLTALLLIGAGGCSNSDTAKPATDTNTATQTPIPTQQTSNSTQSANPTGTQTVVTYSNGKFSPATVTIKVGDSVQFVNSGTTTSRVASDPHPIHNGYPGFDDIKTSKPGETYTFTFTKAGTWGYHDHLNISSKGTVVVK